MPDDDAAQSGRNDAFRLDVPQLLRQSATDARGDLGVLKQQSALEVLPGMQAGTCTWPVGTST